VFGQPSSTSGPRGARKNLHTNLIFISAAWFKKQSSCDVSAHGGEGGEKIFGTTFSMSTKSASSSIVKGTDEIMPLLCKRYKSTACREANGRDSTFSATVLSPSGRTPNSLRHINTRIYCFTVLLHQPLHTVSEHRHDAKSLHNLTQVATLVFGKCSIQIPTANTPNFFLVVFLKLSGQMSEYYIQFGHGRFLPYAVTGGFVKHPPVNYITCVHTHRHKYSHNSCNWLDNAFNQLISR